MPLVQTKGAGSAQGVGQFARQVAANYIEDVFSTYLYTGNGSTQTITNGIDLSTKGGLVWIKRRDGTLNSHRLFDTNRGSTNELKTDSTALEVSAGGEFSSFDSNGFSLGPPYNGGINTTNASIASWTFRKQAKFFDVVTWTGDGTFNGSRAISHSLGSIPGAIIVKSYSNSGTNWIVYHRSLSTGYFCFLNATNAQTQLLASNAVNYVLENVTASSFTVNHGGNSCNSSGVTYVAYLFAHDAGGFGAAGTDNVISCGSYVGGTSPTVNLGWEPQLLLIKCATYGDIYTDWYILDTMRKLDVSNSGNAPLRANTSDAEGGTYGSSAYNLVQPRATGFVVDPSNAGPIATNKTGETYIYMAIRRGPMRTPTSGTSVFGMNFLNLVGPIPAFISSFPVDFALTRNKTTGIAPPADWKAVDRLRGGSASGFRTLITNTAAAEVTSNFLGYGFDYMNGWASSGSNPDWESWMFRRAPGFFDVVCYTGTSNFPQSYNHNLGVAPEMIIVKCRNSTTDGDATFNANWWVGVKGPQSSGANSGYVFSPGLNTTNAVLANDTWGSNVQTATSFIPWYVTLRSGPEGITGQVIGKTYVAYLFATCPGVSKVGSYTGTGTTQQINCGFTGGARFVMIKRTDSTGDWYVWDTARGIVAGNDPYLLLNSTAAEVTGTDYIDPLSTGFEISSTAPAAINANGGSYIFLAIS